MPCICLMTQLLLDQATTVGSDGRNEALPTGLSFSNARPADAATYIEARDVQQQ